MVVSVSEPPPLHVSLFAGPVSTTTCPSPSIHAARRVLFVPSAVYVPGESAVPFSTAAPISSDTFAPTPTFAVSSPSVSVSAWKFAPAPSSTWNVAPAETFSRLNAVNDAPVTSFTVPFSTIRDPVVADTAFEHTNT